MSWRYTVSSTFIISTELACMLSLRLTHTSPANLKLFEASLEFLHFISSSSSTQLHWLWANWIGKVFFPFFLFVAFNFDASAAVAFVEIHIFHHVSLLRVCARCTSPAALSNNLWRTSRGLAGVICDCVVSAHRMREASRNLWLPEVKSFCRRQCENWRRRSCVCQCVVCIDARATKAIHLSHPCHTWKWQGGSRANEIKNRMRKLERKK